MKAAICLLVVLAGCGSDPDVTAVRIVAPFGSPRFDQLEFHLDVGGESRGPLTLPAVPGPLLPSPQDVVVYVPDAWDGRLATCQVRGLRDGDGIDNSYAGSVTVLKHQVVTCSVVFGSAIDGSVFDAPPISLDARPFIDEPVLDALGPADAPALDGSSPDAPPPGVDVAPQHPDGGVPADAAELPDLHVAADVTPTPDRPGDAPPLPPDTAPPTGCAGDGARTAFLDRTQFPGIAGCGAPIAYSAAIAAAANTCAPGWHWCRAEEVGSLPPTEPGTIAGSTCGWIDGTQGMCGDRRNSYGQAACAGGATRSLSVGGPTGSGLPCTGIDLGCNEPWKLAIAFDRWATSSASRMSGGCLEHLGFQCTSSTGGASCWVTCCKN